MMGLGVASAAPFFRMENRPKFIDKLNWLFIKDKTPIDFLVDSIENFELVKLEACCAEHGYLMEVLDSQEKAREQGNTRIKFTKIG